jgi:siroheme decarboxylase
MAEVTGALEKRLLAELEDGLPLTATPYADVAARLGVAEKVVIALLATLQEKDTISRFGVVVRHRELGYHANAMVVWDVPDHEVSQVGSLFANLPFVTLCYRRPRRPPQWPYNLFCMIHGTDRDEVLRQVEQAAKASGMADCPRDVLFSGRRFKQRGARYGKRGKSEEAA